MKPFRGKRRGPQSLRVGFNSPAARRPHRGICKELGVVVKRVAVGALSARGAPRPVRWRSEAPAEGDRSRKGSVLQLWMASTRRRTEEDRTRPLAASVDSCVRSNCGDCCQCPLTAGVRRWRSVVGGLGSVANRSVTCPTRLETRTKESNMCASQWVIRNLGAK